MPIMSGKNRNSPINFMIRIIAEEIPTKYIVITHILLRLSSTTEIRLSKQMDYLQSPGQIIVKERKVRLFHKSLPQIQ